MLRQLDELGIFTSGQHGQTPAPTRYAIRQVIDQECKKYLIRKTAEARQARYQARGVDELDGLSNPTSINGSQERTNRQGKKPAEVKRDFFGRVISDNRGDPKDKDNRQRFVSKDSVLERKVWISFHEGFSNAVRKPITLEEMMRSF